MISLRGRSKENTIFRNYTTDPLPPGVSAGASGNYNHESHDNHEASSIVYLRVLRSSRFWLLPDLRQRILQRAALRGRHCTHLAGHPGSNKIRNLVHEI